jgi:hypothetical protein
MTRGLLFWILMILRFLSAVFGVRVLGDNALYLSTGLLLILFGLLGWKVYGPPIQG